MNTDASLNIQKQRVGRGIVARKDDGGLIGAWADSEDKLGEPAVEEALAIRQALNIAKQKGWRKVLIQSDCKGIIDKINARKAADPHIGVILFDILKLRQVFTECSFSFIKREGNFVAHHLAKFAINLMNDFEWQDSFPEWLTSLARNDVGASAPALYSLFHD